MSKDLTYGVTALFDTVDDLVHAVDETVRKGYTHFDAHTPYPVHGLDRRARLKPSNLGYFAFVFGLLGALSAIGFITWVTVTDYPLIIGGKPFWSWPAFVPVVFEVTVLLASVLSTVTMIVLYFKFPNNAHPLHDTPYMKSVSADKYGLCIEATDPKFEIGTAKDFLRHAGGKHITTISFVPEDMEHSLRLFDTRFLGVLAVTVLAVSAVTYGVLNHALSLPPFDWMMEQPKLKAQMPSELFTDGKGMRVPVAGTVARGFLPYAFKGKPGEAGKYLVNPLLPTREVLERGKAKYLTFCSPCHGNVGEGDSRLQGQFPNPPTLHSDKARAWRDGNIYHVITDGQNIMPSYASQIPQDDRWAIVHYVRVLQRAHNAKESDLP